MAGSTGINVATKLAEIKHSFKRHLPGKLDEIESLWASLGTAKTYDKSLDDLRRMVHSLAGSGGTFGAGAVSRIAKELEQILDSEFIRLNQKSDAATSILNAVGDGIAELRQVAENWQPSDVPYIQNTTIKRNGLGNLIYLAEDDEYFAADLIIHLEQARYRVKHFAKLSDFEKACEDELPDIVIMDVVFQDGDAAGADIIKRLRNRTESFPSVIFISVRGDMASRLAATRAGARRYFHKPLEINKLIQTVNGFTERTVKTPFRILLIDDDETLLEYYAAVLREAGMDIKTLSNPLEALTLIQEFKPDVVVTDVYMPDCSGPELAQVIRQDDTWALMPILFLSTESDMDRRLMALNFGGDDFLIKPVEVSHLETAIRTKAKRARWANRLNNDLSVALRENKFQLATMDQHDLVSTTDVAGRITNVNDKFCKISGYSREELLGQNHNILKSGKHPDEYYSELWQTISGGNVWHGRLCNRKKNGEEYWVESTIVPFLNDAGKPYKYVSARTDITTLVQTEQDLILAREEAESANHAKSQFLSSMSHELRTPMNAIMGFGQLLRMETEQPLNASQQENVDEIFKASHHLLDLINEVLDLAKIESGRVDLSMEPVGFTQVIIESLQLIMPLAQRRGIDITLTLNGSAMTVEQLSQKHHAVRVDRIRLKQVMLNLLSNAVKYNHENGKVVIDCAIKEKFARVSIVDTGPGLDAAQQAQLFKPFMRLGAQQSEVEGVGIGLVITKNLVELMGGTIGIDSELGKGCCFWAEFPNDILPSEMTAQQDVALPLEMNELIKCHGVLYIEDNPANLRLVKQLLAKKTNIHMWSAPEPRLGLELAAEHKPEVILLDINLPGMNGFEVLQHLRSRAETRETPIIAISANAMPSDIEKGLAAGFDDYITKPIDVNLLLKAIERNLHGNS
ncbi:hypothetical protein MNBD_ALPHA03-302 [hydrothermal vent metagenome]|uniref:histidine kinase n=1 Tax=hydrothermal vent metagenome TaxID=652676 RepID=A0A3B1B7F1_9ZZZZ